MDVPCAIGVEGVVMTDSVMQASENLEKYEDPLAQIKAEFDDVSQVCSLRRPSSVVPASSRYHPMPEKAFLMLLPSSDGADSLASCGAGAVLHRQVSDKGAGLFPYPRSISGYGS
jgi:hypothetical protein